MGTVTTGSVTGILPAGTISGSSQVSFTTIADKPALVSGSGQISYTGITDVPAGIVSGSAQASDWTVASASYATTASYAANAIEELPEGLVSGSEQISFTGIVDKPALVSGSEQIDLGSATGTATSASYAVTASYAANAIEELPAGLVSGSSQIDHNSTQNYVADEHFTQANITTVGTVTTGSVTAILPAGSVSGSSQVSFTTIADKPALVSGSEQISFTTIADKPALVSGSEQISYTGITDVPAGIVSSSDQASGWTVASASFAVTASYAENATAELPEGVVSGSEQISFTGITDKPALVSGSEQIDLGSATGTATSASYAVTASYAENAGGGSEIPAGTVSSSIQVDHNATTNYSSDEHFTQANITTVGTVTTGDVSAILPAGSVSSSDQASTWTVASASYATTASYAENAGDTIDWYSASDASFTITGGEVTQSSLLMSGSIEIECHNNHVYTFPTASMTVVGEATTQTLTNKTVSGSFHGYDASRVIISVDEPSGTANQAAVWYQVTGSGPWKEIVATWIYDDS